MLSGDLGELLAEFRNAVLTANIAYSLEKLSPIRTKHSDGTFWRNSPVEILCQKFSTRNSPVELRRIEKLRWSLSEAARSLFVFTSD